MVSTHALNGSTDDSQHQGYTDAQHLICGYSINSIQQLNHSPVKMHSDPSDNFLYSLVGSAGEVEAILDGACKARLNATELKRC